ncbi:metallopeptidase family protein [Xanthobacter sp. AM11]|uniref:metallopeptidase family protein n=1 Tax=Xanthobacter sp. AM11 TaxID=3380643 RepID=UPI0039BFE594
MGEGRSSHPGTPRRSSWHDVEAPGIAEFEQLAREAYERLPRSFRDLCRDLLIRIEDFPTDEVLDAMDAEGPFDLLGLFQGIGHAQGGAVPQTGQMPNMVFLYRRPILDYWAENEETLGDVVTHVLVHEIGHHFGLSDADMDDIEDRAD